jgi:hypothetical protein
MCARHKTHMLCVVLSSTRNSASHDTASPTTACVLRGSVCLPPTRITAHYRQLCSSCERSTLHNFPPCTLNAVSTAAARQVLHSPVSRNITPSYVCARLEATYFSFTIRIIASSGWRRRRHTVSHSTASLCHDLFDRYSTYWHTADPIGASSCVRRVALRPETSVATIVLSFCASYHIAQRR